LGREGPIAIFLPRNINSVSLGWSVMRAGYDGPIVLERNVLNKQEIENGNSLFGSSLSKHNIAAYHAVIV
jgi:hypothetical protein